jgi:hypothetical protein
MSTDIQRRRVAIAALTLAASSAAAARTETAAQPSIDVEAPDDVFVVATPGKAGPVKIGDLIFQLKSYRLVQWQSRLTLISKQLEILERPFNDGRINEEITLLKTKADNLKNIRDIAAQRLADADLSIKLGLRNKHVDRYQTFIPVTNTTSGTTKGTTGSTESTKSTTQETSNTSSSAGLSNSNSTSQSNGSSSSSGTSDTTESSTTTSQAANVLYMSYDDISTSASQTDNEYQDAQLAAGQADRKRQDALDKLTLSKQKLSEQQQILNQLQATMNVSAAASGVFELLVGVGSFVKKGHLLGRIVL